MEDAIPLGLSKPNCEEIWGNQRAVVDGHEQKKMVSSVL